jgi:hypothetical protein
MFPVLHIIHPTPCAASSAFVLCCLLWVVLWALTIVARSWQLYKTGYWIDSRIYWITHSYSVQCTLQLTTVDHNTRLATAPQPAFHCTVFSWPSLFTGSSPKTAYWNCSSSELTVAAPSWLITHWNCQPSTSSAQNQSHFMTNDQSVSPSWCRAPSGAHDQILISVWHLLFCQCQVSSLMRGRVCHLY